MRQPMMAATATYLKMFDYRRNKSERFTYTLYEMVKMNSIFSMIRATNKVTRNILRRLHRLMRRKVAERAGCYLD
jgi:hypothetical protein